MTDIAVLGQDPRFGGGGRAQIEAFLAGARSLGREPHLVSLAYRGLHGRPPSGDVVTSLKPAVPGLDGLNQAIAARRVMPLLRSARSVWAVTTVASHGYGAARSGRGYSAWISTSLEQEWKARRRGLGLSRRAALTVSSPTLRRLERETLRQASRVFAISPASRAGLAEAGGLDPETIAILPIPVDTVVFAPSPDEEWRAQLEDAPTLVYVGRRDDPRKNLPLLLDAFRAIRRDRPTTRLLLVGSGPATREHEGLEVAGEVPDVARLLRQGTLFVLPSLQEGFGIAAAEALACGLPVVTTPSGGPEDLVERSGGGCVLEGFSSVELASTVLALLREPDTLERMRAAGRAYVAQEHAPTRFRKLLGDALR